MKAMRPGIACASPFIAWSLISTPGKPTPVFVIGRWKEKSVERYLVSSLKTYSAIQHQ
jgi:hypothetical protein